MKKLFLLFATVTLLIGVQACKQKEEAAAEDTTEVTTEVAADAVTGDSTAASDTTKVPVPPTDPKKGG